MILTDDIQFFWASLLIEELVRNGVDMFYISPGSRSTPLTYAVAKNDRAQYRIIYDERSAAFHALGYAKAKGRAAALICTSGSALAHYFPAIIEAENSQVPLIILSADRPSELQNSGSNQTINQNNFYAQYSQWFMNLEPPTEKIPVPYLLSTIDDMVYSAHRAPAGTVHLNCMFREPLTPNNTPLSQQYTSNITQWLQSTKPFTDYSHNNTRLENIPVEFIASRVSQAERPLIAIGNIGNADIKVIQNFIESTDIPIFADIQSGVRSASQEHLINYYDVILLEDQVFQNKPDLILQFGEQQVSKRFMQYTQDSKITIISVVDHQKKIDPVSNVDIRIECDYNIAFQALTSTIRNKNWTQYWADRNHTVEQTLNNELQAFSEAFVVRHIDSLLNDEHIFLASSMAVRATDMFSGKGHQNRYYSNRGASGIDGTISSALGLSDATQKDVFLFIGDLAFIHDLNALSLIQRSTQHIKIILFNNKGGGIFNFLPIAQQEDVFEEFFETPHEFTFNNVCKDFGIEYYHADNKNSFTNTIQHIIPSPCSLIFEIELDRRDNFAVYKDIHAKIKHGLQ